MITFELLGAATQYKSLRRVAFVYESDTMLPTTGAFGEWLELPIEWGDLRQHT